MSTYSIYLKNFRAVKEATIKLDGITVLAGPNSSGKSTISKFFYHFMKSLFKFEENLNTKYFKYLQSITNTIIVMLKNIVAIDGYGKIREYLKFLDNFFKDHNPEIALTNEKIDELIDNIGYILKYIEQEGLEYDNFYRLNGIFSREEQVKLAEHIENSDIDGVIELLKERIIEENEKIEEEIESRELKVVERDLEFIENIVYPYASLHHNENFAIEKNRNSLITKNGTIEYVENKSSNILLLEAVHNFTGNKNTYTPKRREIDYSLLNDFKDTRFLDGDVVLENGQFQFIQNGNHYDLSESASGVNAVASLLVEYKDGHIGKDDIVIIDEPEVHLHPAWIVEYARIIVELRKRTEAIFLIATHSPPMVDAIQAISQEQEIENELNCYLSKPYEDEPYKYTFESQGSDIQELYRSFNEFMPRIAEYTTYNDE